MKRPYFKIKFSYVIILIIVFGITATSFALQKFEEGREYQKLISFASQLDYNASNHLAEYRTCWDWGFPYSRCGTVLYYSTSLNKEGFQGNIDSIFSTRELPQTTDGHTILSTLVAQQNTNGEKTNKYTLTIDGLWNEQNRELIFEPTAYKWIVVTQKEIWTIFFYDVLNDGHEYRMNERLINGNIVVIILEKK